MGCTIKEISEATGFSSATISNALNHKKGVNSETATAIITVAQKLGYVEERKVKRIKFVIFKTNGLIIDDTPFFPLLIDGVQKECKNSGMEMSICNLDKRDADYEEQANALSEDASTAVILLGTELEESDLDLFQNSKCPFLLLDYWASDMSFNGVLINNADSSRTAVEYLLKKGHREIGYLRGDFRIKAFRSRAVGYKVALEKAGISARDEYVVTLATTMDGAYKDMQEFLKKKPILPTAYFADNDMVALGAMKALTEEGIKIPEQISIIGFDDLPFCEIASPRLSTIRVSKQEMGRLAVKRLMQIVNGDEESKLKMQVCTQFIERDSVCTVCGNKEGKDD